MKNDQKSGFCVVLVVGYRFRNGVLIELIIDIQSIIN